MIQTDRCLFYRRLFSPLIDDCRIGVITEKQDTLSCAVADFFPGFGRRGSVRVNEGGWADIWIAEGRGSDGCILIN